MGGISPAGDADRGPLATIMGCHSVSGIAISVGQYRGSGSSCKVCRIYDGNQPAPPFAEAT